MFSATTSTQLNQLSVDILRKPKRISVERENSTAATVGHVETQLIKSVKQSYFSELIGRKTGVRFLCS
ncbi:hypothetical protein O9993_21020 [Vibrio lentus]|nr:hypothetical protein [Vibrio lentus]